MKMPEYDSANASNIGVLHSLNYDHEYITDVEHLVALYRRARAVLRGNLSKKRALDIGTFRGHSAAALVLAGCKVVSVDKVIPDLRNIHYGLFDEVEFIQKDGKEYIAEAVDKGLEYNVIMHDSEHGPQIFPELQNAWELLDNDGLLAVHDAHFFSITEFLGTLEEIQSYEVLVDGKGRQLLFVYKM